MPICSAKGGKNGLFKAWCWTVKCFPRERDISAHFSSRLERRGPGTGLQDCAITKAGVDMPGVLDFVSAREKGGHGTQRCTASLLWSPWEAGGDAGSEVEAECHLSELLGAQMVLGLWRLECYCTGSFLGDNLCLFLPIPGTSSALPS